MTTTLPDPPLPPNSPELHRRVTLTMQATIALGLALELYEQQWLNTAIVAAILLLTALPALVARGARLFVPAQFELLAIALRRIEAAASDRRWTYFVDTSQYVTPSAKTTAAVATMYSGCNSLK